MMKKPCACGCGQMIIRDPNANTFNWRTRKYLNDAHKQRHDYHKRQVRKAWKEKYLKPNEHKLPEKIVPADHPLLTVRLWRV